MAVAAEALLKLRTVFDGSGIDRATQAINALRKEAGIKTETPLKRVAGGLEQVNRTATRLATGGLVGTGAGITYSIAKAVEFENSLSDMKKALDLKKGSPMLNQLQDDFLKLSRRVPVAAKDLSEIGGIASLSGYSDPKAILQFTENAAKIGTAFDMSGRDAAEALISIKAQLGLTDKATLDLMGTVNTLSDKFDGVVDPRDIIAGLKRGLGALGKTAGLSGEQTSGFLTSFLGAGVPLDNAITGAKNFLKVLTGGDSLSKEKMQGLEQLFGLPVDPVRKQLQDQLGQINKEITSGIDGVGQQRSEALEKLIDDAKFQGKKLIDFEGQTLTLSQAGLIKKKLDSETSAYTKGLKERAKEIQAQLKKMPGGGEMIAKDLAKRMQVDPTGTIMDVLQRIKKLPKEQQAGVMNQIFGDESILAISAITENLGLVKKGFDISADATQNATSWLNEYNNKLENTSSQFQLLKNAFNEMAIRVGTAMLPVLTKAMQDLTPTIIELIPVVVDLARAGLPVLVDGLKALLPYVQRFSAWVKEDPQRLKDLISTIGKVAAAFIALGVAAGVIRNIITLFGALRTVAGLVKAVFSGGGKGRPGGGLGGLLDLLKGGGPKGGGSAGGLLATIRGWFGSAMAAVGPLASGLGGALARAAGTIGAMMRGGLAGIGNPLKMFFDTLRGFTPQMVMKNGEWVKPLAVKLAEALRGAFSGLGNIGAGGMGGLFARLGQGALSLLPVLATVGRAVLAFFSGPVGWITLLATAGVLIYKFRDQIISALGPVAAALKPVGDLLGKIGLFLLDLVTGAAPAKAGGAPGGIATAFQGIGNLWNTYVITPIRTGWTALMAWFMQSVAGPWVMMWQGYASIFNTYVITPLRAMWQGFVLYVLQTIQAYAVVWWQGVTAGFQTYVIIPLQQLWTGFTTWLGTSIGYIRTLFAGIWNGIAANFQTYVLTPIQQGWGVFVQWFFQSTATVRQWLLNLWQGVSTNFYSYVVKPIQDGWGGLTQWLSTTVGNVRGWFGSMWNGLATGFSTQIVQPIQNLWNGALTYVRSAWSSTTSWFSGMFRNISNFFSTNLVQPIRNMWTGLVNGIQGLISQTFGWLRNLGNAVVGSVNRVRQAAGMPPIEGFATGGYVNGPTLAWVGEGRDSEYIVPAGKMAAASMAYLNGARGMDVINGKIPGFARGGFVTRSGGRGSGDKSRGVKRGMRAGAGSIKEQLAALDAAMRSSRRTLRASLADSIRYQMRRAEIISGSREWQRGAPVGGGPMYLGLSTNKFLGPAVLNTQWDYDKADGAGGLGQRTLLKRQEWWGGYFASGGYVKGPTLGLIGEGKDNEYIIPERRMAESAMAYLNGARGTSVLTRRVPGFANGGVVGRRHPMSDFVNSRGGGDTAVIDRPIEITTGPVMEFNGDRYVTMEDYQRGLREVKRQTLGELRTAAGRRATGR